MINRGKIPTMKRTAAAVMALGLVAGACSSSSGDSAEETDDTTAEDEAVTDDDTVEVVQSEGGTLAAVQEAGVLRCGGNETLPGFGIVDSEGAYSGFDID